jgi:hypothetical protein
MSLKTNPDDASSTLPLSSAAVALLQLVKKHTSLDEAHLKEEAQTALDEPNVFDACFALLRKKGWVERGGAGWRTTKQGQDWLESATDSASTEDEELGTSDQPKKPYDVAKLKVEQRTLSVFQALRKIESRKS